VTQCCHCEDPELVEGDEAILDRRAPFLTEAIGRMGDRRAPFLTEAIGRMGAWRPWTLDIGRCSWNLELDNNTALCNKKSL
jgi:hypothetical protein